MIRFDSKFRKVFLSRRLKLSKSVVKTKRTANENCLHDASPRAGEGYHSFEWVDGIPRINSIFLKRYCDA